uniref:Uncharacterized protein n=1 Tax=Oryza glaberrima TaxID=4538 RepID=I1P918_ORYGL
TGGATNAVWAAGGATRAPAGAAAARVGVAAVTAPTPALPRGPARRRCRMARRRKARPAARARRRPVLDLRGGRLSLGVEGMAWWSGDGRCARWLCGVLMGNRWRKPCQAMGWHDDGDAIWRHSPPWRRRPGVDPS